MRDTAYNTRRTRRSVLAITGGLIATGLGSGLGVAQDDPWDDEQWPIEDRENADEVVDSDTSDDIETDGDVVVAADVDLDGRVDAGGSVVLAADAEVDQDVTAGEHVLLEEDAEVEGSVEAGGDVVLRDDAEVEGDVTAGGEVVLEGDAEVEGEIFENDAEVDADADDGTENNATG